MKDRIKLGMFTPNYPGLTGEGGIGTYAKRMSQELIANGHEVNLLTVGDRDNGFDEGRPIDFTSAGYARGFDRLWPGAGACFRVGQAMLRLVKKHSLNVVEFPNWEGLAPYFALRKNVPLVVRLHTSSQETIRIDGLKMNRVRRADIRRERLTARMADLLVTHSRAHQYAMAEELEIDPDRIRVIPHGIQPAGDSLIQREAATVLFLGRMERRKGTLDLLHAVPLVLTEVPDARFTLIGADRPHCPGGRTHAQYLADEFSPAVRERVTLEGRLPDEQVEHWLQRATMLVVPSLYESFGLTLLEAMRWGTPVVGARSGGIPEIIQDGVSGVLVPPANSKELAAAIISLLKDNRRRCQLGEAGRLRCETEFSIKRTTALAVDLYSEAINRRKR